MSLLVSNLSGCVVSVLTDYKPIILVVMHQTSDSNHVVPESCEMVTNENVYLTVDCLFNEDHLLQCNQNDAAWLIIQEYFGVEKVMIRFSDVIDVSHSQRGIH